jgi:hypothetical protein
MTALGAPLPLLGFTNSLPLAIGLAAVFGAGSIVAEVVADTSLQRSLDPAVLARGYGFVVPANIAGIGGGALLAPLLVAWFGFSGTLVFAGVAVMAYSALVLAHSVGLLRRRRFTVRAGVHILQVDAVGASGASSADAPGGLGGTRSPGGR